MSRHGGSCRFKIDRDRIAIAATLVLIAGIVVLPLGPPGHAAAGVERISQFASGLGTVGGAT